MDIAIIGFIVGDLSIFIYRINLMSDELKGITSYQIRDYTSNLCYSLL